MAQLYRGLIMKSFKEFIKKDNKVKHNIADYTPSHGSHSQVSDKKNVADYIPSHGSHSQNTHKESYDIQEARAPKTTGWYEFEGHNPNPHLGSIEDNREKMEHSPESWEENHEPHEKEAIRSYTRKSRDLNQHLIAVGNGRKSPLEDEPNDSDYTKNWKHGMRAQVEKNVSGLDTVLNRSKTPHRMTVLHGMNMETSKDFHPGEAASRHPDRHVTFPAYLSTSIHPQIAASFARPARGYAANEAANEPSPHPTHVLRIKMKKGQKGYKYIGDRSAMPGEYEGLLARNTTLKIAKKPEIVRHPSGGEMHVWDAHIVDDKDEK